MALLAMRAARCWPEAVGGSELGGCRSKYEVVWTQKRGETKKSYDNEQKSNKRTDGSANVHDKKYVRRKLWICLHRIRGFAAFQSRNDVLGGELGHLTPRLFGRGGDVRS